MRKKASRSRSSDPNSLSLLLGVAVFVISVTYLGSDYIGLLSLGAHERSLVAQVANGVPPQPSIAWVRPSADASPLQWQLSGGTSAKHYVYIDESTCPGSLDYVTASPSQVGANDTYGPQDAYVASLASIPNGAKVTGMYLRPCAALLPTGSATSSSFWVYGQVRKANTLVLGKVVQKYIPTSVTSKWMSTGYMSFGDKSFIKTATSSYELRMGLRFDKAAKRGVRVNAYVAGIEYVMPQANFAPAAPSELGAFFYKNICSIRRDRADSGETYPGVYAHWKDNSSNELRNFLNRKPPTPNYRNYVLTDGYAGVVVNGANVTFASDETLVLSDGTIWYPPNGLLSYRATAQSYVGSVFYMSSSSNMVNITVSNVGSRVKLHQPTSLAASYNPHENIVKLTWDNRSECATHFRVERRRSGGAWENTGLTDAGVGSYKDSYAISPNITSYDQSPLSPGNYEYRVASVRLDEFEREITSGYSNPVATTIPALP